MNRRSGETAGLNASKLSVAAPVSTLTITTRDTEAPMSPTTIIRSWYLPVSALDREHQTVVKFLRLNCDLAIAIETLLAGRFRLTAPGDWDFDLLASRSKICFPVIWQAASGTTVPVIVIIYVVARARRMAFASRTIILNLPGGTDIRVRVRCNVEQLVVAGIRYSLQRIGIHGNVRVRQHVSAFASDTRNRVEGIARVGTHGIFAAA